MADSPAVVAVAAAVAVGKSIMTDNFYLQLINSDKLGKIIDLAKEIWPKTYASILSVEQITYMMDLMYSEEKLKQEFQSGILFYLMKLNHKEIGYTTVEPNYKDEPQLYIHKIYILPNLQGKGFGQKAIAALVQIAQQHKLNSILLNVNRRNQALDFYKKTGFVIEREEDIPIGNDYWMNDYVMRKQLT